MAKKKCRSRRPNPVRVGPAYGDYERTSLCPQPDPGPVEDPGTPAVYSTPEEVIERERSERAAEVADRWWYRDRHDAAQLLRYRLKGDDCDVNLQAALVDGGYWADGWPQKGKVPLYRVYEWLGKSPVFVCEGEYAVESAIGMGLPAVTSAGGPQDVEHSDWGPLAGRQVVIVPTHSDKGRAFGRAVARMVLGLDPPPEVRMLALPGLEQGQDIGDFGWDSGLSPQALADRMRELAARVPVMKPADLEGGPVCGRLADALPTAVRWLWPGRVAIGKPVVIFGGLDRGKSIVALNLAARVSVGGQWPDGQGRAPRGKVILMSRDDHLCDTIRPRLDQAGADAERIITLNWVTRVVGGKEIQRDITLRDLADLERAVEMAGNVRLVVIDPLSAYLGPDMPGRQRILPAIRGLADLADRRGLAVVVTAEFGGRDGLGYGANMALISAVRSAWMLAPEPGNRCLLLPLKNNVGEGVAALACRISHNAVEWEPVAASADQVLGAGFPPPARGQALHQPAVRLSNGPAPSSSNRRRSGPKRLAREAATQWLQQHLANGPVLAGTSSAGEGTVRGAAKSAGLAWATVQRAFRDLQGVSEVCPNTRKHLWRLPGARSASGEGGATAGNVKIDPNASVCTPNTK